jgi:hypothetical protein
VVLSTLSKFSLNFKYEERELLLYRSSSDLASTITMSVKERRQEEGRHAPSRVKHGLADNASSSKSNFAKGKEAEASSSDDDEDDILARTSLDLSNHPMPPLEALAKTIAKFSRLQKLDLSSMKSSSSNPKGLSSLQWLGRATRKGKEKATDEEIFGNSLTWLKMTDNPALGEQTGDDAWAGIENLASLAGEKAMAYEMPDEYSLLSFLSFISPQCIVLCFDNGTTGICSPQAVFSSSFGTRTQLHNKFRIYSASASSQHLGLVTQQDRKASKGFSCQFAITQETQHHAECTAMVKKREPSTRFHSMLSLTRGSFEWE